jgi:hypothetical protein
MSGPIAFAISLVVAIVTGVASSFLWLVALRLVRPQIRIGPEMAWIPKENELRFKIINVSRRAMVDVNFDLSVIRPVAEGGGLTEMRERVLLPGVPPLIIPGRKGSHSHNAYRILAVLPPGYVFDGTYQRWLRLRVFVRDEVSGVGRVFEQEYTHPNSLVSGTFRRGNTFVIDRAHEGFPLP